MVVAMGVFVPDAVGRALGVLVRVGVFVRVGVAVAVGVAAIVGYSVCKGATRVG